MKSTIDLTKVNSKSMSSLLQNNINEVNNSIQSGSVKNVYDTVSKIFSEAGLNTTASNRLLTNISKSKSSTEAGFIVWNSFLSGTGNSVIS